MKKIMIRAALLSAVFSLAVAVPVWAATVTDFAKTFTVTVPAGLADEQLSDFPLLVRLGSGIQGFDYADFRQDGADLLVTDDADNPLPYELENWDTNGTSRLWVQVPLVETGTVVHVYYGSYEIVTPVPGMWSGYAGVWHLNETGDGAVSVLDATTNRLNGAAQSVSLAVTNGALGRARRIAQDNNHAAGIIVDVLSDPAKKAAAERLGTDFHASFWMLSQATKVDQNDSNNNIKWGNLVGRRKGDEGKSWGFSFGGSTDQQFPATVEYMRVYSDDKAYKCTANQIGAVLKLNDGVWKKVDVVWRYDGGAAKQYADVYTNGVFVESVELTGTVKQEDANIGIGCSTQTEYGSSPNTKKGRRFNGSMDEVRLCYGAASAARIAAEWRQESGAVSAVCGAAVNVDDTAPVLGAPSIVRNADGTFTVSVAISESDAAAGSVKCLAGGGGFAMSTADATLPKTYAGTLSTLAGLPASTTLVYSVQARSTGGTTVSRNGAEAFFTGDLSVAKIADANESGLVPGAFRITRADAAGDLVVNYTLAGTAVAGRTYRALSGTVTIPDGATFADVAIVPLLDDATTADSTVVLALAPGLYGIAASAASATMTIENAEINVWSASAAGLASVAGNWSLGHAPLASELALFDGAVSQADCEWDAAAPRAVAGWTQASSYTGTVTLCTVFPGKGAFTNLVVAGEMVVDGGFLTHPQSRTMGDYHVEDWDWLGDLKANETYRIRVSAGSLHVGAGAVIDARGKGYHVTNGGCRMLGCSHGGRVGETSPPCYGDPREPIHIGLPFHPNGTYLNGKGGGAIYLDVAGAAVVDGTIRADAWDASIPGSASKAGAMGAAGSVFLRADTLSGSGRITAMGTGPSEEGIVYDGKPTENNYKGTGGRVAIATREPVDRSTFAAISAEGYWMGLPDANWRAQYGGGSGTVVFRDATRPNGLLVVAQQSGAIAPDLDFGGKYPTFWRCPSVTDEGDWTFDAIEFGHRGFLRVPVGTTLTLPGGLASCYGTETDPEALGGLRYEGGALNIGAGDQTIADRWMFVPWTNFVFSGSVAVSNNAAIGFHPLTGNVDNSDTLAIFPVCSFEVRGDLTVTSDSWLRATDCGFVKESLGATSGMLGVGSHGGRSFYIGRDESGVPLSRAYDSVFSPRLPGCTADKLRAAGGVIVCRVDGTFRLDGTAIASGLPESRVNSGGPTGGAGGTISIEAGCFVGAGTVKASGGNYDNRTGPGGRVAVRLTAPDADFSGFAGSFDVGGGSWWKGGTNAVCDASAGTVYLKTAADGEKGGIIRIAMDPVNAGYIRNRIKGGNPANTNTTEMVSLGYGGDSLKDYKNARYEIANYGRAAVNVDFRAQSVTLADDTAILDLEGHALMLKDFCWVTDSGVVTNTLKAGTYSAAALAGLGAPVEDSSSGGGTVVIRRGNFVLKLR